MHLLTHGQKQHRFTFKLNGFFKKHMRHFIEKTVSIMEFSVLEGWGLCNLHKGTEEICLLEILSCHYIVFLSSIELISRRFKERKHIRPHLSLTCSYKWKRVKITFQRKIYTFVIVKVSLIVFYLITFYSSNYWPRYVFRLDRIIINIHLWF